MNENEKSIVGSIRQIPWGPFYEVISIEGDEVLVEFPESGERTRLSLQEVLTTPLKE